MWRRPISIVLMVITLATVALALGLSLTGAQKSPTASSSAGEPAPSGKPLLQSLAQVEPGVITPASGGLANPFTALPASAAPLVDTANKPVIIFDGSEPCIGCAPQRWTLVVALTRFGTFAHLPLLVLPAGSSNPALASFSFAGAAYSSKYLTFVGVEKKDFTGKPLQTLPADAQQASDSFNAPPYVPAATAGFIPWLDIANRYSLQGSTYAPSVIGNLDWGHIETRLSKGSDPVTKAVVGSANWLTAAICKTTNMQPAAVCTSAPIAGLVTQLP